MLTIKLTATCPDNTVIKNHPNLLTHKLKTENNTVYEFALRKHSMYITHVYCIDSCGVTGSGKTTTIINIVK